MRATSVLGVVLALSFPAFAQTGGQVTGLVTDPSGSVIVGATVTITNSQTNVVRKTITNSAGSYAFPALQPDVYNVKAEMQGFKGELREDHSAVWVEELSTHKQRGNKLLVKGSTALNRGTLLLLGPAAAKSSSKPATTRSYASSST